MQTQELRKQVDKENFLFLACVSAYTCFFLFLLVCLKCGPGFMSQVVVYTGLRLGAFGIIMASIEVKKTLFSLSTVAANLVSIFKNKLTAITT